MKAQVRKEQRRVEKKVALETEATSLGIPVEELKFRNWEEVQAIRRKEPDVSGFLSRNEQYSTWNWR